MHNPKEDVFIDVNHIPLGVNFKDHIDGKVARVRRVARIDWSRLAKCAGPPDGRTAVGQS